MKLILTLMCLGTASMAMAENFTVVLRGVVSSGIDGSGDFGLANADLTGRHFTVTSIADLSIPGTLFIQNSPYGDSIASISGAGYNAPNALTTTLSINGGALTLNDFTYGSAYLGYEYDYPSIGSSSMSHISDQNISYVENDQYTLNLNLFSNALFGGPPAFSNRFSYTVRPDDGAFGYLGAVQCSANFASCTNTSLNLRITGITGLGSSPVPEGSTWLLFVSGFYACAAVARRGRRLKQLTVGSAPSRDVRRTV